MLQSGLVFAGANVSIEKGTGEGIVTVLDLSGLDLKGTDLVVLSANAIVHRQFNTHYPHGKSRRRL